MHALNQALHIKSISVSYKTPKGPFLAVSNATCSISRGSCLALVGESGCGKTTLAKTIAGLLTPSSGTISLDHHPSLFGTKKWHKKIQILFQDPDSVFNPKRTIGWHLDEAITLWHPDYSIKEKQKKILSLLDSVELSEEALLRHSFELSGGQKQRASLVRSLLVEPEYLILDEPLASQDASKRKSLIALLKSLQATFTLGFLYITHDLSTLSKLADTVAVMQNGIIREMKSTDELFTKAEHPYTKKLLESRTKVLEKELRERTSSY